MKINELIGKVFNPKKWIASLIHFIRDFPHMVKHTVLFSIFFILLFYYVIGKVFALLAKIPVVGKPFIGIIGLWKRTAGKGLGGIVAKLEHVGTSVNRSYLIELAMKNLVSRKSRTFVTIAGMSVGIGIIVLLLSMGYGIERLIIGRIASLDELRMFDVSAGGNSAVHLDGKFIAKLNRISNVQKTLPLVATVGKLSYKNATTDVLVYASSKTYLQYSKIKFLNGGFFSNNQEYRPTTAENALSYAGGSVAGAETELRKGKLNQLISQDTVSFNILPEKAVSVWENCAIAPKLLGYTVRYEGGYTGQEYWGGIYAPFLPYGRSGYDSATKTELGKWMKGKVPLFEKHADESLVPVLDKYGRQTWETGCLEETEIQVTDRIAVGEVLGEATASAGLNTTASDSASLAYEETVVASSSSGLEFVSLEASAGASVKSDKQKTIAFNGSPDGETIVSSGLLNLLGIPIKEAIGKVFNIQLIVTKSLLSTIDGRVLSPEVQYKIKGVTDDLDSTSMYIPYTDMAKLNINNFSQVKVVVNDPSALANARKRAEVLGFSTSSTVDTVNQIESLFANLRIVLAVVGMVALIVASLGMFNTLTVSLLERTREIGGMKTMGVVSEEIQDLLLAEAIIMGIAGGLGGLFLGYLIGKVLSLIVSLFALTQGQGFLDLTYIPVPFIVFIMISSFIVGVLTGLYPARRAKNISALNALRYE